MPQPQDVVNNYDSNKMFFVVAEFRNSGYFIGEFTTFEDANKEHSEIVNLSMEYFHELYKIRGNLKGFKEYKINEIKFLERYDISRTNN